MDLHDAVLQVRAGKRVERAERLVHQQDLGLHGECPRDAHALFHAARHFVRPLVLGLGHLHQFEIVHHPVVALGLGLRGAEHLVDGDRDVAVDGQPRQQRVVLEHDGAVGPGFVDDLAFEEDLAICRFQQAAQDVEQGRLAASRMADQRHELALIDAQVHVAQHFRRHLAAAEAHADLFELEIGLGCHGRVLPYCAETPCDTK